MDWLMCIMMIILFAAVLVLLWKNYRIKKEAKLFAEKVEDALDAIVTGKECRACISEKRRRRFS